MTEERTLRTADIDAPNRCGFVLTPMCVESLRLNGKPEFISSPVGLVPNVLVMSNVVKEADSYVLIRGVDQS